MGTAKEAWEALRDQQNHEEQQALRGKFTVRPVEPETAPEERGLTLNISSLLDADKTQIQDLSKHIVDKVAHGELDPVKAYIHAKKILEAATLLVDNLRPYAADHINVAKGENLVMYNMKFTQAEVGVKYDYASSGDKEYDELMIKFNALKEEKDAKEKELKSLKKAQERVDTATGETYTVTPPVKKGQVSFKSELQ